MPIFVFAVFDSIADQVVDHSFELFGIGNDLCILICIVDVIQMEILRFKVKRKLINAICKVVFQIDGNKIIRQRVLLYFGIDRQLIDQISHIIGFCVDCLQIFLLLIRCICDTIQYSFGISFDRSDRCFKIMRYTTHDLAGIIFRLDSFVDDLF